MFLRHKLRRKDGKEHRYWSIVENRRVSGGRTVQRHVLYLGEINDSQRAAWCQTIEAFDENGQSGKQIALFPEDRAAPPLDCDVVHVRLSGLRLRRPRQWGGCWLACHLWDQLQLDEFWAPRLPPSRQATRWLNVLKTLVAYRLIDPGSEWRLHRQWFDRSAMGDLLGEDFDLVQKDTLYRCLDKLLTHKTELFSFLQQRWTSSAAVRRPAAKSPSDRNDGRVTGVSGIEEGFLGPGPSVRTACLRRGSHPRRLSSPHRDGRPLPVGYRHPVNRLGPKHTLCSGGDSGRGTRNESRNRTGNPIPSHRTRCGPRRQASGSSRTR